MQEATPRDLLAILTSVSISPYDLEKYIEERDDSAEGIVDFGRIWDRLQIPRDKEGYFDGFVPSYSRWRAETINVGGPSKHITVLKIAMNGGADRRYLVFDTEENESPAEHWRFCGYIDLFNNYEGSEANEYLKIVSNASHIWMVLRSYPHIGTGVENTDEMWYRIDGENPTHVLKYPVEGARVMGDLSDLEYEARIAETESQVDVVAQRIQYRVRFGVSGRRPFHWLFSKIVLVSFVWDEDEQRFAVDNSRSNISAEEVGYRFGSWDEQRFIKYNLERAMRLAKRGNREQIDWCEHAISKTHDASQRQSLLDSLND